MNFKCPVCQSTQYTNSFILFLAWVWNDNHSIICTKCGHEIMLNPEFIVKPIRINYVRR